MQPERDRRIVDHLHVARMLARKMHRERPYLNGEELQQEAAEALIRATDSYDPSRGMSYFSWIWNRIRDALKDYARRVSGSRNATPRATVLSLDVPVGEADDEETLVDRVRAPDASTELKAEAGLTIEQVKQLRGREREVMIRLARGESHGEIARRLGVHDTRIFAIADTARARILRKQQQGGR